MQVYTSTKSGMPIRLSVEADRYGVPQVYAHLRTGKDIDERRVLCEGWGIRKVESGFQEGILTPGMILDVSRHKWNEALKVREELRDRSNLAQIHLMRVKSRGSHVDIDGYTLNARVDEQTWKRIAHLMQWVDSASSGDILEGDHFTGYIVKAGMESEVEHLLNVAPEKRMCAVIQNPHQ